MDTTVTDLYRDATPGEFAAFVSALVETSRPSAEEIRAALARFVQATARTKQEAFYGLVTSLFTALGLPASQTPGGDTNNRIDVLIYDPSRSVPVEAKSPTETVEINVKSVQQALENKVVLVARRSDDHPTTRDASTLVVGYEYPAERSDVHEIVSDVQATYGVNVGLLTLWDLYGLVLDYYLLDCDVSGDVSRILGLAGSY